MTQEALAAIANSFANGHDPDESDEWWTTPNSLAEEAVAALHAADLSIVSTEELEGLRSAAWEVAAWGVTQSTRYAYSCRSCGNDMTEPMTARHDDGCPIGDLRAALEGAKP
jgi:hypothetical protein